MADQTPAPQTPHWSVQLLCVTCIGFTLLTIGGYLASAEPKVVENLLISASGAVFAVFGGPILRAKVVNGQEIKNG